jgi:bacillithiol biosynthesis deacetylase BshB1
LVVALRRYRPDIVLANAVRDRHPDHGRAAGLIYDSCFLSGLARIETTDGGKPQQAWRPSAVYHYIQSQYIRPDFVVDVTAHWAKKMEAITAYSSQFHNPDSKEPETFISTPNFLPFIEARATELGHSIGVKYGEGFTSSRHIGVKSLSSLI